MIYFFLPKTAKRGCTIPLYWLELSKAHSSPYRLFGPTSQTSLTAEQMILSPHTSLHPALQVCRFGIISSFTLTFNSQFINHFYWNFSFQSFGLTHFLLGLRSLHFINIFFWHQFYTLIHSSCCKKLLNSLALKCILRVREAEVLTDPYWFSISLTWKKILTFYTV